MHSSSRFPTFLRAVLAEPFTRPSSRNINLCKKLYTDGWIESLFCFSTIFQKIFCSMHHQNCGLLKSILCVKNFHSKFNRFVKIIHLVRWIKFTPRNQYQINLQLNTMPKYICSLIMI